MIKVVSGVAIVDGRILMGKRKSGNGKLRPGLWELPGGKIEPGESPEVALKREWQEELGLELRSVGSPIATCVFHVEQVIHVVLYEVRLTDGWRATLDSAADQSMPMIGKTNQWWGGFVDHDELCLVEPMRAVRYLPCSPGFYLHFDDLRGWMRATERWTDPENATVLDRLRPSRTSMFTVNIPESGVAMVSYPKSPAKMETIVAVGPPHTRPPLDPPSSFPSAPLQLETLTLADLAEILAKHDTQAIVAQRVRSACECRASIRTRAGVGPVGRGPDLGSALLALLVELHAGKPEGAS